MRGRTIAILRERLRYSVRAYGDVSLTDLVRMSGELASWFATLPEGSRYGIAQALRQALQAGIRWGHMQRNPAKLAGPNRQPSPRTVRAFSLEEIDAIAAELAKTSTSRRQVPLTRRAVAALDAIPARIDTPLLFPAPAGGLLRLDHFRHRQWGPAIEASGVARPARIYDLRSTFASRAIAAGVPIFEIAKIMGTSVRMIERHYGTLLDALART
ncbi:MAG: hypothetical protein ACYDHH_11710 [Solirubrobacteraceae bacterium]